MNLVELIGRLTKEPEIRYTNTQLAVCKFTLAINRGKDSKGNDLGAEYPRITVFGKQGENAHRYLTKGRQVAVQGRIQTGSYKDDNGNTVYTTDVVADRVEYLEYGEKAKEEKPKEEVTPEAPEQIGFAALDEEVPW